MGAPAPSLLREAVLWARLPSMSPSVGQPCPALAASRFVPLATGLLPVAPAVAQYPWHSLPRLRPHLE